MQKQICKLKIWFLNFLLKSHFCRLFYQNFKQPYLSSAKGLTHFSHEQILARSQTFIKHLSRQNLLIFLSFGFKLGPFVCTEEKCQLKSNTRMHSGGLKDLQLGIKVKTKGKKTYLMKGLGNTGHSECKFFQRFFTLCTGGQENFKLVLRQLVCFPFYSDLLRFIFQIAGKAVLYNSIIRLEENGKQAMLVATQLVRTNSEVSFRELTSADVLNKIQPGRLDSFNLGTTSAIHNLACTYKTGAEKNFSKLDSIK